MQAIGCKSGHIFAVFGLPAFLAGLLEGAPLFDDGRHFAAQVLFAARQCQFDLLLPFAELL